MIIKSAEIQEGTDILLLNCDGKLDLRASQAFEAELAERAAGSDRIVLDMAGISYITSSGLRVLLSFIKKLKSSSGVLKLAALTAPVEEAFRSSRLTEVFDIYPTVREAMEAMGS
jgi:anti-sigma B factor antagonist